MEYVVVVHGIAKGFKEKLSPTLTHTKKKIFTLRDMERAL
jgi:hypothetical protein